MLSSFMCSQAEVLDKMGKIDLCGDFYFVFSSHLFVYELSINYRFVKIYQNHLVYIKLNLDEKS